MERARGRQCTSLLRSEGSSRWLQALWPLQLVKTFKRVIQLIYLGLKQYWNHTLGVRVCLLNFSNLSSKRSNQDFIHLMSLSLASRVFLLRKRRLWSHKFQKRSQQCLKVLRFVTKPKSANRSHRSQIWTQTFLIEWYPIKHKIFS